MAESSVQRPASKGHPSKNLLDMNHLKLAKLGVALSIIRSKPASRSAKEHAEHLASMYISSQHRLKDRLDKARTEILSLKQQILMSSGTSQTAAVLVPGERVANDSQSLFPTPPSDVSPTPGASNQIEIPNTDKKTLSRDITFLHHILSLHRIGTAVISQGSTAPSSQTTSQLTLTEVTLGTLERSLGAIRDVLSDETETVSASLVAQALASIVRVLERVPRNHGYVRCRDVLMDIMSQVMEKFMATDSFEEVSDIPQTRLLELLSCFYHTSSLDLLHAALNVISRRIEAFCATLRHPIGHFCPVAAENTCRLTSTLDVCVQRNRRLLSSGDGHAVCAEIQAVLETSLLHLTRTHPLLAQAIWKVSRSVEMCLSQTWSAHW